MKCPKCGYISFDYNQVCPKCNKNISAEQEKIFLPSFRPEPPSLLGFLTGEANESNMNLHGSQNSRMGVDQASDISLGDSAILDRSFGLDEQDLEMSIVPEDSGEALFEQETMIEPEKLFSDSDFSLEGKEEGEIAMPSESADEEESSLDLGDLSLEESDDIPDFSMEESEKPQEPVAMDLEFDDASFSLESLDSLPVEIENGENELEPEVELNLEDLKVSDLGDLEIEEEMKASEKELEGTLVEPGMESGDEDMEAEAFLLEEQEVDLDNLPGMSDLITEETGSGGKDKTIVLSDFSLDDAESAGEVEGFEFNDMPLEASAPEEESLDLEGFDLDVNDSGEMGKSLNLDDLSMNDSAELEKSFDLSDISVDEYSDQEASTTGENLSSSDDIDLDLDAMSLDVEEYQKKPAPGEDDFVLDLEDMDIDLDLNEPKK